VPILVAGNLPAMLRRAARVADGWITIGLKNAELKTAIDLLRNELREQGAGSRAAARSECPNRQRP
jgi:alkanesulfonate monooxygenase SsuD/methylene tetrahydromethanopterin reductase-like flavin-dependent oxidoreductase (luciferase family)